MDFTNQYCCPLQWQISIHGSWASNQDQFTRLPLRQTQQCCTGWVVALFSPAAADIGSLCLKDTESRGRKGGGLMMLTTIINTALFYYWSTCCLPQFRLIHYATHQPWQFQKHQFWRHDRPDQEARHRMSTSHYQIKELQGAAPVPILCPVYCWVKQILGTIRLSILFKYTQSNKRNLPSIRCNNLAL